MNIGFSDASFAANRDLSTLLNYTVFISDGDRIIIPILFRSYKARRVARSVMEATQIAFRNLLDAAFTLRGTTYIQIMFSKI